MKKYLCTLIVILLPSICYAGVWNKVGNFLIHPKVVFTLDIVFSYSHVYYDATSDAIAWGYYADGKHERMHGANPKAWHRYKNLSRVSLLGLGYTSFALMYNVLNNKVSWKTLLYYKLPTIIGMNGVWQSRYHYVRYEEYLGKYYNFAIPTFGDDISVYFKDKEAQIINSVQLFTGCAGLVYGAKSIFFEQ